MLDRKAAYEILGVREGATKDEIVKRYGILVRKYRAAAGSPSAKPSPDSGPQMDEVNLAYDILMGYADSPEAEDGAAGRSGHLCRKVGLDKRKIGDFFYYNKWYFIAGLVLLLIAVYTVKEITGRVPADLNIVFIGAFSPADTDTAQQKVKAAFPQSKAAAVDVIPILEEGARQDYAYRMKATAVMAAGDMDIVITDRERFRSYGGQGAFKSLDGLDPDLRAGKALKLKAEGEDREHIYGVDVGANGLIKDLGISGNEFIASISSKARHPDRAAEFLRLISK